MTGLYKDALYSNALNNKTIRILRCENIIFSTQKKMGRKLSYIYIFFFVTYETGLENQDTTNIVNKMW